MREAVGTQSSISTMPKPFHHILLIISAVELEVYFKEEGMATKIFVNLPVKDLKRSIEYFSQLGYQFNPQFTDQTAACMIASDNIYVMLLTMAKFKEFTPKKVADATKTTEVLVCLSMESRAAVDEIISKAVGAGGTTFSQPMEYGFMYGRSFQDLDGHIWEFIWMDPSAMDQK